MKLLPLLVKIKPLARLLNLPAMGEAEVLLITVNTVPIGKMPVPVSVKVNGTPLLMITPRALTFPATAVTPVEDVLRLSTHKAGLARARENFCRRNSTTMPDTMSERGLA